MSMFNLRPGYYSIRFDDEELEAIRTACEAVAEGNRLLLDQSGRAGMEEYVKLVKEVNDALVAGSLAALFKPGQEVLIQREDLEPIRVVLLKSREDAPEEHGAVLRRALDKIDDCLSVTAGKS